MYQINGTRGMSLINVNEGTMRHNFYAYRKTDNNAGSITLLLNPYLNSLKRKLEWLPTNYRMPKDQHNPIEGYTIWHTLDNSRS